MSAVWASKAVRHWAGGLWWALVCAAVSAHGVYAEPGAHETPADARQRIESEYSHSGLSGPAVAQAREAVQRWPDDAGARVCLSRMLLEAGQLDAAAAAATEALALPGLQPYDRAHALTLQAQVAFCRGEWEDAHASCEAALAVDPAEHWPVIAEARRLLARVRCLQALEAWPRYATPLCDVSAPPGTAAEAVRVAASAQGLLDRLDKTLGVEAGRVHIYLYTSAEQAKQARSDAAQLHLGIVLNDVEVRARQVHVMLGDSVGPHLARLATARLGEYRVAVPMIEDGASRYFGRDPDTPVAAAAASPELSLPDWRYVPEDDAAQAEAFVGWLVQTHGIERFAHFWNRLAWEPLPDALQTVYERSAAEVNEAWHAGGS